MTLHFEKPGSNPGGVARTDDQTGSLADGLNPSGQLSADASGLPSVTRIISESGLGVNYSRIPPRTLEAAQVRGKLVHQACEYAATDDLDMDTVPKMLRGYVDAFLAFKCDVRWEPILIETRLVHPLGFTGQPDTIGWMHGTQRRQLDLKTPTSLAEGPVLLQLAAYDGLYAVNFSTAPLGGTDTLQLGRDGRYRLRSRTDLLPIAWGVFVAALCLINGTATRAQLTALDAWVKRYPTTH